MKRARIRKGLVLISFASIFALGCELIVDFDRTKIPVETTETGAPGDATLPEAATDAPVDAPADVDIDAQGQDAGSDVTTSDAADAADDG